MKPYFKDDDNRWAATLVSYNAGPRTVIDRMTVCGLTKGCDTRAWFHGLDSVMSPREKKLLYGKPLYVRINEYPNNVIHIRADKYKPYWESIALNEDSEPIMTPIPQPTITSTTQPATQAATQPARLPVITPSPLDNLIDNLIEYSNQFIAYLKRSL